ncbi:hypothetical protein [Streptomyces sp. NPDC093018]|uniref:hypothetical protein n=1 Tax=Streptomyces sp. NPDC093018 TaxID=3155067 RepID=UPI00343DC25A
MIDRYLRAYESRPSRAEAIGDLTRLCRLEGRWPLAHLFAARAAVIPRPEDILFVEMSWHEWRALDELAVASYWIGDYAKSREYCTRLLDGGKVPEGERALIAANLEFAQEKSAPAHRPHPPPPPRERTPPSDILRDARTLGVLGS